MGGRTLLCRKQPQSALPGFSSSSSRSVQSGEAALGLGGALERCSQSGPFQSLLGPCAALNHAVMAARSRVRSRELDARSVPSCLPEASVEPTGCGVSMGSKAPLCGTSEPGLARWCLFKLSCSAPAETLTSKSGLDSRDPPSPFEAESCQITCLQDTPIKQTQL